MNGTLEAYYKAVTQKFYSIANVELLYQNYRAKGELVTRGRHNS